MSKTINANQLNLYRVEWQLAKRILRQTLSPKDAEAERHALHIKALGSDKSSMCLTNEELDKVLQAFRAISRPADAAGQIELEQMPATRLRVYIGHLLAALDEEEGYAEQIISRMQRGRKQSSTGAASMATLDTLGEDGLKKVMVALKIETRRRWRTKDELLGEIAIIRADNCFPELPTKAAVMQALNRKAMPPLEALAYEPLLIVLATLKRLAYGKLPFPVATVEPTNENENYVQSES